MISVVTPTYNRCRLLNRLYKSLIENKKSFTDFEWVIIDDGSTDETKKTVNKWILDNKINIKYFYQSNKGKMQALNNVMMKTSGNIIVEVDSDDYLNKEALKTIDNDFKLVNEKIYAIAYKKKMNEYKNDFKFSKVIKIFDLYNRYNFEGELLLAFDGSIRRRYKHLIEPGERFVTEARMYNILDTKERGIILNDSDLIVCEYQQDGYTLNMKELFKNNPLGFYEYFNECLEMDLKKIKFMKKIYFIKHLILFATILEKKKSEVLGDLKNTNFLIRVLVVIMFYFGKYFTKKHGYLDKI